jgi:Uma2 family endonuclease
MSPSPTPKHQNLAARVVSLIDTYLIRQPVGHVYVDIDVYVGKGPSGRDIVYRPDVVFVRAAPGEDVPERLWNTPQLVVEVLSPSTRRQDLETKKADYERAGVLEYWVLDPKKKKMTFYRLLDARYEEVDPESDRFSSDAIPGFVLDLSLVRAAFGKANTP